MQITLDFLFFFFLFNVMKRWLENRVKLAFDFLRDPKIKILTYHHQTKQRGQVGGVENKRRCSRYVLGGEIGDDAVDEILSHDDSADRLPVGGILPKQKADGLQSDLHERRRIAHRSHFHQMLLLYRFHRCILQTVWRCP